MWPAPPEGSRTRRNHPNYRSDNSLVLVHSDFVFWFSRIYFNMPYMLKYIIRRTRLRYLQSNGAVRFAQRVCRYASVNPYVRLLGINHFVCSNLPNTWKQIKCRSWPGSPWYVAASLCCTLSSFPPVRYTSRCRLFCHQGCDFILSEKLLVLSLCFLHRDVFFLEM